MSKQRIILVFILICCMTAVSFREKNGAEGWITATKEEVLTDYTKAMGWFTQTPNYQVKVRYVSFTNHHSMNVYEKTEGYYKRDKQCFQNVMLGIKVLQNEKIRLTVDTINKLMILNNTSKLDQLPVDNEKLSELLSKVSALKKQILQNGTLRYRLEFKPNQLYSAYEFELNEASLLSKMIYFYSTELKQENENGTLIQGKPRVEIIFNEYRENIKFIYEKEFSEKIFVKAIEKKYVPKEKYNDYELKDYRFNEKK